MNWATGFRTKGDVDILFLSGLPAAIPSRTCPPELRRRSETAKARSLVGFGVQVRQCLDDIKNNLELMGASLQNIVMFRYYLPWREDVFDMRDEMYAFSRSTSLPPARISSSGSTLSPASA